MAQTHWRADQDGAFAAGENWSGGRAPGFGDDAILDAPGSTPYTISAATNATVASIQTAPDALLDILANVSATGGTGTGANDGAIRIENGATLTLQGTVNNNGSIEIFGSLATTSIVLGSGGVDLIGGGAVFLDFTGGPHQQIVSASNGSTLTTSQRISGQGLIGGPGLTIITNSGGGFLEAKGGPLTIDTGDRTIVNGGLIDAEGFPSYPYVAGQGLVLSPVENNGIVECDGQGATMTFDGAVTGAGRASITGGVLRFNDSFNQNVGFTRTTGALSLAQSENYTGLINGFSATGGEFLDLSDIAYVGIGEATFSGTTKNGVLTVSDGLHTAHIRLNGDFSASVFVTSSDGAGGVSITTGLKSIHWKSPVSGLFSTSADWTDGVTPGPLNDAILDAAGAAYTVTSNASEAVADLQIVADATLALTAPFTATANVTVAGALEVDNGARLTTGAAAIVSGRIDLNAKNGLTEVILAGTTLSGGGEVRLDDSAANAIVGVSGSSTLTNVSDTIDGAGNIGVGRLSLVNETGGRIVSDQSVNGLLINTGANIIINAGLLEGAGAGLRVLSAVENDGLVKAVTSLAFSRAVTGAGRALIAGGTLRFLGAFNQAATFIGAGGVLALAQSRLYTGGVYGFGPSGGDSLDLMDIGFTGPGEATFSGAPTLGVLTVSDGVHTAHVTLHGDFLGSTFLTRADGQGGVIVTDAAPLHSFVAAMAAHGAAEAAPTALAASTPPTLLIAAPAH